MPSAGQPCGAWGPSACPFFRGGPSLSISRPPPPETLAESPGQASLPIRGWPGLLRCWWLGELLVQEVQTAVGKGLKSTLGERIRALSCSASPWRGAGREGGEEEEDEGKELHFVSVLDVGASVELDGRTDRPRLPRTRSEARGLWVCPWQARALLCLGVF